MGIVIIFFVFISLLFLLTTIFFFLRNHLLFVLLLKGFELEVDKYEIKKQNKRPYNKVKNPLFLIFIILIIKNDEFKASLELDHIFLSFSQY